MDNGHFIGYVPLPGSFILQGAFQMLDWIGYYKIMFSWYNPMFYVNMVLIPIPAIWALSHIFILPVKKSVLRL
jgi:hypothetical protein